MVRLVPRQVIGQGVRGIRKRLGMSRPEFARTLGVEDEEVVRAWEEGRDQPDYGTLARIATMGLVDVMASPPADDDEGEVLALPAASAHGIVPDEAAELREILGRMEVLMDQARAIVERAARRTPVDLQPMEVLVVADDTAATAPAKSGSRKGAAKTAKSTSGTTSRAKKSSTGSGSSSGSTTAAKKPSSAKPGGSGAKKTASRSRTRTPGGSSTSG